MTQKTQQHRDLLIKYICASVPHKLKVQVKSITNFAPTLVGLTGNNLFLQIGGVGSLYNLIEDDIKPYLRPLSSMTEEEYQELLSLTGFDTTQITEGIVWFTSGLNIYVKDDITALIDWLIAKHFDYLGLILMDLALPAPKEMYKMKGAKY